MSSYFDREGSRPIHTEEVTFDVGEAVDGVYRSDTEASLRTWAGMGPDGGRVRFWTRSSWRWTAGASR